MRFFIAYESRASEKLLRKLFNDWDVNKWLAYNPNVPQDILEKLASDENVTIRRRVARNANLLPLLRRIAKEEKDKDVLVSLAKNPSIPLDVVEILYERGIIWEKYKKRLLSNEVPPEELAKSLNALPEELKELSTSEDKYIREKVAENLNTPQDVLEKLSRDEEYNVRAGVAENSNTPILVLETLSKDEDRFVRSRVASNLNTPGLILEKLWKDENTWVLSSIARNPNTPVSILEDLSKHGNDDIRQGVARNPNTPTEILSKFVNDKEDIIRYLLLNPNITKEIVKIIASKSISILKKDRIFEFKDGNFRDIFERLDAEKFFKVIFEARKEEKQKELIRSIQKQQQELDKLNAFDKSKNDRVELKAEVENN